MVLSCCPFLLTLFFFYLLFLGLTVAGQEIFELVHSQEEASGNECSIGVSTSEADPVLVSSMVMAGEIWSRAHVLSSCPSNRVNSISVGRCVRRHEHRWDFVLTTVRKLYCSLVRCGMAMEMKVSAALCSDWLGPLFSFLHDASSAFAIDMLSRATARPKTAERLGLSRGRDIRTAKGRRRLSFSHTSSSLRRIRPVAFQVTSHSARKPSPPSLELPPPPDDPVSLPPDASPLLVPPASPLDVLMLPTPPCSPPPVSPAPAAAGEGRIGGPWCVAKPTMPAELLKEAMYFACGNRGARCKEIEPGGSCCYPDSFEARFSYSFSSWQAAKVSGGRRSCSFDDATLHVNSDPSRVSSVATIREQLS